MKTTRNQNLLATALAGALIAGCVPSEQAPPASRPAAAQQAQAAGPNPLRNAYFGDTHVHTSWSPDAFVSGVRVGPEDAYRYAKGEAIDHISGQKVQLKSGPLDFYAVTDHSEYMGVLPGMLDPNNPLSKHEIAKLMNSSDPAQQQKATMLVVGSIAGGKPIKEFVDKGVMKQQWQLIQDYAAKYNEPGKFTTFIGYEWTSNPDNRNLHRNVIFRGIRVPELPFTNFDSAKPEDLWTFMEGARKAGMENLAIPHNPNYSDGTMFQTVDSYGKPIDRAYAERRITNEPVVEMTQIKGTSETNPALSPNDEFADFMISDFLIAGEQTGKLRGKAKGSYARDALRTGLVLDEQTGVNPYKFGQIGSSDTHNAGGDYEENNVFGKIGREDGTPEARLVHKTQLTPIVQSWGSAGLAGVWAEENTRESLYDAMKRKEVFATTGPRMKVRFFGSWQYDDADAKSADLVKIGYAKGVAMGSDLAARPAAAKAPSFLVWAIKDPNSGNLDRIQIVKGWSKNGQTMEKVYDVVWSGTRKPDAKTGKLPPVGNTVDVATGTYQNTIGTADLAGRWTDPEFDPAQRAFYYVRALEIPTPRWNVFDAIKLGIAPPANLPTTLQERAFSSPIWYTPTAAELGTARAAALTVHSVEKQGGKALTDAEIRALIVGKSIRIKNTVTGQTFEALYGGDGQRTLASTVGFAAMHGGGTGKNPYAIKNGQLQGSLDDGSSFTSRIFKVGDRYVGARSDEAGYVNYEVAAIR
jgi:hypothetical protein